MKTKKDFWRTIVIAYILILLGISILFFVDRDNPFEIYLLLGTIVGVTLWFKFNNLESGKTKLMIPFVGVFVN